MCSSDLTTSGARELAVDPHDEAEVDEVERPDEVHGRHAHAHAAVRCRVVGHAGHAVDRDTTLEVLRAVDLAEIALPPSVAALAIDSPQAARGDRITAVDLPFELVLVVNVQLFELRNELVVVRKVIRYHNATGGVK